MWRTSLWTKRHNGSFAGSRTDLWFKRLLHLLCLLHLPLHFHHVEPLRCRHHGQLWLPHQVPAFDVSNSSTVYSFIVTRLDICSTFMETQTQLLWNRHLCMLLLKRICCHFHCIRRIWKIYRVQCCGENSRLGRNRCKIRSHLDGCNHPLSVQFCWLQVFDLAGQEISLDFCWMVVLVILFQGILLVGGYSLAGSAS